VNVTKPKHVVCFLIWYQVIVNNIHGTSKASHTLCLGDAPKK
jgi:hypothetical protein